MKTGQLKYRLTYIALKWAAMLPLCVLYRLSDAAAWIMRHIIKYRRDMVRTNLQRCFPEADKRQIAQYERHFYRHLADTIVESLKLLHISDRQIDRRVEVVDSDLVDRAIESGHPVVLFLGHYGNWEWVTAICRHFKSNAVMGQIYHPLSSKTADRIMLKLRSRFNSESIPMQRTLRRLLEIEKSGRHFVIGFISDQRPVGQHLNDWMDFFGIDTPIITGGETIGDRVGAIYLYVDVERLKRGYYRLTFKPVIPALEDVAKGIHAPYTRQYMRMLEQTIRRDPPYWLWSHNRFHRKRPKPGGAVDEASPSEQNS